MKLHRQPRCCPRCCPPRSSMPAFFTHPQPGRYASVAGSTALVVALGTRMAPVPVPAVRRRPPRAPGAASSSFNGACSQGTAVAVGRMPAVAVGSSSRRVAVRPPRHAQQGAAPGRAAATSWSSCHPGQVLLGGRCRVTAGPLHRRRMSKPAALRHICRTLDTRDEAQHAGPPPVPFCVVNDWVSLRSTGPVCIPSSSHFRGVGMRHHGVPVARVGAMWLMMRRW